MNSDVLPRCRQAWKVEDEVMFASSREGNKNDGEEKSSGRLLHDKYLAPCKRLVSGETFSSLRSVEHISRHPVLTSCLLSNTTSIALAALRPADLVNASNV